jgi:hypothetical protein
VARKKAKGPRRRRNTAIGLINTTEAFIQLNIATQLVAKNNPINFLLGNTSTGAVMGSGGWAYGADVLSLKELIMRFNKPHGGSGTYATMTEGEIAWKNIQDGWFNAAWQSVAVGAGFRIGRKLLRRPIAQGNRMLKMAGVKDLVKL